MAADPTAGATGWWPPTAGSSTCDAPFYGSTGAHPPEPAHRGDGGTTRRRGLLAGGLRRRHLQLRRCPFYGSTGAIHLDKPIVGMAADPATGGYWLVASDGGIFSFDAPFHGSDGGHATSTSPSWGWRPTRRTGGYWLVASDGGIFSFNDPLPGVDGSHDPQQAHRGDGGRPDHRRLLAGGLRRRDLQLRTPRSKVPRAP